MHTDSHGIHTRTRVRIFCPTWLHLDCSLYNQWVRMWCLHFYTECALFILFCFVSFRLHSVATYKESYETRWTVWGEDLHWIQQNLHRNLFFVLLLWIEHICVLVCVLACKSKNGRYWNHNGVVSAWDIQLFNMTKIYCFKANTPRIIYLYATCASFNCFRSYIDVMCVCALERECVSLTECVALYCSSYTS